MPIIQRYIIKEFLKYFCLVEAVVISLFVIVDYISRIGRFVERDMSLIDGFGFVLLFVPYMFILLMPVCCILASVIVFGLMMRNNEILALKSGGTSVYYLIRPVIILGVLFTLIFFVVAEYVVPVSQTKANRIKLALRGKTVATTKDNNIWIKKNRSIVHIKYYNYIKKQISGVTIYQFSDTFNLIGRIDAVTGVYEDGSWLFNDVLVIKPGVESGIFVSEFLTDKKMRIDLKPEDLKSVIKRSQEMSIREMYGLVKKMTSEGYDPVLYKVDLHGKIAFPFACLLMGILGAGIVFIGKKSQGLAVSIGIGICAAFFYWFFHSFCLSLGYGEIFPPVIAAWIANFLFICGTGIVLLNAE